MPSRTDEVQAGVDAHVELLLARRLLLLPHVRLVLVVDEVDDRRPAIAVVDIVAEAGRVDDGQPDAEVLLLELGFDDVAAPSATAMVAERTSRSSCRIASHDGGCSCESRRAPSRRWCWPIRRETASADALDQRRLAEPRLAHDHQREVPSPLGDCEVSRRWCGRAHRSDAVGSAASRCQCRPVRSSALLLRSKQQIRRWLAQLDQVADPAQQERSAGVSRQCKSPVHDSARAVSMPRRADGAQARERRRTGAAGPRFACAIAQGQRGALTRGAGRGKVRRRVDGTRSRVARTRFRRADDAGIRARCTVV